MVLTNYIRLTPGIPARLHFTDDYIIDRTIADRETGGTKRIRSLVFQVDTYDSQDVARTFSIMSQKLAAIFEPYLKDRIYREYDFIITEMGEGFYKDWNVQPIRRPEE
jgi:hypothetical protein